MASILSQSGLGVSLVAPPGGLSSSEGIELAGRMLEWQMKNDNSFPALSEQLRIGADGLGFTVSGLTDMDYPTLEIGAGGQPLLRQTSVVNRIPLPPELIQHFKHMQSYCMMGLFPNINRAWLSIDRELYVWTYEDGGDLAYFDGLSEPIIAVDLVNPKPGVFQPHIQYLLCLATTVEIVLLGVSFSGQNSNYEEMHLLPEPLFAVPTDGAHIQTLRGTLDGRIFMGAKDGCIYEFFYQAEEGFFGRKCRKINHSKSTLSFLVPSFINSVFYEEEPVVQIDIDHSRHILYARTEKGSLQVYDLGSDGNSMTHIASMSLANLVQCASNIARSVDRTTFKPLVSISALQSSESTNVHLVAVASSGVRFYLSCISGCKSAAEVTPSARPATLQLVHVRLPPGYAANAPSQRPRPVHAALYAQGTLLLSTSTGTDVSENDVLWTLSNSLLPGTPAAPATHLSETQSAVLLDGRAWALCQVPASPASSSKIPPAPEPPMVVTQHTSRPRQFVLLTTQCCHILTQLRPVDLLRQLLVDAGGADSTALRAFFQVLRPDQACATALILACANNIQDLQVADWATQALLLHGGQMAAAGLQTLPASPFTSPMVGQHHQQFGTSFASPISNFHPGAISTPQLPSYASVDAAAAVELQFSGKHNGLYLYLGRILKPIWLLPLARLLGVGKAHLLDSVVTSDQLLAIIHQMNALQLFVAKNIQQQQLVQQQQQAANNSLYTPAAGDGAGLHKARIQEAQLQERKSLTALKQLVEHTGQVLGLWKILCDHQLHLLGQLMSAELKCQLQSILFRDLILNGADTCMLLISALVDRYLDDSANTDAISGKLREVCPSLYRTEDALCTKINEQLMKASVEQNRAEKERLLQQAVDNCRQIPTRIDLGAVCRQLSASQFFAGVVHLALCVAEKRDPHNRALQWYNASTADDRQQQQQMAAISQNATLARKECYEQICSVLQHLYAMAASHPQSPSVPKSPGPVIASSGVVDSVASAQQLSPGEAQRLADETLTLALNSDDELCHVAIFDWLSDRRCDDKLLDVRSPFLEKYLKRQAQEAAASGAEDVVAKHDLLWKFHERSGNLMGAAGVLSRLADAHSTAVPLSRRVEYLSRAIVCARAAVTSYGNAAHGQFLHELEEKMDVAKVQCQILEAVRQLPVGSRPQSVVQQAIVGLNADLLDVTQLYEQFAEPLHLWQCKLAILHCAGHYDQALVANVWTHIIGDAARLPASGFATRMRDLALAYAQSDQFFPLDLIIRTLESNLASQEDAADAWPVATLLSAGVSLARLFTAYNKLFTCKDTVRQTHPNRILYVLLDIVNRLAATPSLVPVGDRRAFVGQCIDAVTLYLTELYCTAHVGASSDLISKFRGVQAKLERL